MNWLNPIWLWSLAAVPVAVGLMLFAAMRRRAATRQFGDQSLVARLTRSVSVRRRRWKGACITAAVGLLALSLAGPRFGTKLREVEREGIDLVIALDVSLSMMAEDVAPNRLERARNEIKKLLESLRGDRVGLVLFAGDAFIQTPLTTDYGAVRLFLDVADPSLIPTPGTDFGEALKIALRAFQAPHAGGPDEPRTRALLFVSDGENHVADIEQILGEARAENVVIFAAGVGETDGVPIPLYRGSRRVDFKKDGAGRVVTTRLEEAALQDLAADGTYFRIARTSSSLSSLTTALERLDRTTFGAEEFEEYEEQYQWPLALALLLLMVELAVSDRVRTREDALALYTESAETS
ncbi:MAG: VWA domain-containing protein [Rhodothermales bacterium]|nr:VWA domain-containing protein [Rhodothermales bacterium]MBO6779516.1 VWA domain-containing protein [Rhodothermales bacterium]